MEVDKAIKLRIESSKKPVICSIIALGFLAFIICIIVAATVTPEVVDSESLTIENCNKGGTLLCFDSKDLIHTYHMNLILEKYNQFLYLEIDFNSNNTIDSELGFNFTLLAEDGKSNHLIKKKNRTIDIDCEKGYCKSRSLLYIPYIYYTDYSLTLAINGSLETDSMIFRLKFITKEFTKYFLGVKYFFFSISVISNLLFILSIRRIPFRFWSFQTRLVGVMGISLMIFNEPLLAATLNLLSPGWSGLSVFCNIQFVVFLLLFWLASLQHFQDFKCKIIALILEAIFLVIIFSLLFVVYLYATINYRYNPTFDWKKQYGKPERAIYGAFIFFIVAFALWIAFLTIWSLLNFNSYMLRDKIFRISNIIMMIVTFIGIGVGSFQPLPRTTTLLLLSVAVFNIYFIIVQWLYTPSYFSYLQYIQEIATIPNENPNNIDPNDTLSHQQIENKI
ncbi:hypothetical protein SteCoe_25909 [Stentor coeruleus]|uniref:Wntless-like transmembrane domain-containing protein n=1 Tax=Stentor coeruleus TaxID=5963 RepID=A0A1R2BE18_9CILI|nr:hypothetical protein SteCoe_25909 [Stentor coeruleus]